MWKKYLLMILAIIGVATYVEAQHAPGRYPIIYPSAEFSAGGSVSISMADDVPIYYGDGNDCWVEWDTAGTDDYQLTCTNIDGAGTDGIIWYVNDGSGIMYVVSGLDLSDANLTNVGSIALDGLTADATSNGITIGGTGAASTESITWKFGETGNIVDVSTATGVTDIDFGAINLATDALDVSDGNITNVGDIALDSLTADATSGGVTIGGTGAATAESLTFKFGETSNVVDISSATSATSITAAGITITPGALFLADDTTIGWGNVAAAPDAIAEWDTAQTPDALLISTSSGVLVGATAVAADFTKARVVASHSDSGYTLTDQLVGIVGEAASDGSSHANGGVFAGKSNGAKYGIGITARGRVGATGDTGSAVGGWFATDTTHASGDNVGIYAKASGSSTANTAVLINAGTIEWDGKTTMQGGTTDGNLVITDVAGTSFGLLQFGGVTSSFPAWKRSGASFIAQLADDSTKCDVYADEFISTTGSTSAGYVRYKTNKNAYSDLAATVESVTFAGNPGDASKVTVASVIPDGVWLTGVTTRVTTAGTNCTGYTVGDGANADIYGTAGAVVQGTTTDPASAGATWGNPILANSEVTITAVGGNCFSMVVAITSHYIRMTAATSN